MAEPSVPFSLLDAARIVARGGSLDAKLEALREQAIAAAQGGDVALLLLDADAGVLVSTDGQAIIQIAEGGPEIASAIADRTVVFTETTPPALAGLLPNAAPAVIVPLVTVHEEGADVEGLLAVSGAVQASGDGAMLEGLVAIADLSAVAIRQARLWNAAWEQSDHADRLLHTDRLTGLANRVTFERMLELEVARASRQGTPLAIAVVDVNGLPGIGSAHGERTADDILRHVAAAIADRVRLLDTVARFGDDEFVVIAPGDAGGMVALRLRDAIAQLPPVRGIPISISAAVVHHPADGATSDELVAASEAALERAREAGPGTVLGVLEPTA
jgi:diguanylate cyclase (GGDEF)-like protein